MLATWRQFMGIDDAPMSDLARMPADEAWVYRCLALRSDFARSVPLRVWVRTPDGLRLADDVGDEAGIELRTLLENVNPVNSDWADLIGWTITSLGVWGESFWAKVRGQLTGRPRELYWLRPSDVDPQVRDGWVVAWRLRSGVRQISYSPRDLVIARRPNPANPLRGLSPLSAARHDVRASATAAEATAGLISNWSVPPGVWVPDQGAVVTDEDRRLITRVLRALRKPQNRGQTPVMTVPLRWQQVGLSPKDADWLMARQESRLAICAALGVPPILAGGATEASAYRQAIDAERVFARNMVGELELVASAINSWLVPDFDPGHRLVVGFDYSAVPALQPPWTERWNAWINAVGAQVVTPNEMRAEFRLGGPVPWGDQPTPKAAVSLAGPPMTGEAPTVTAPTISGPGDEPADDVSVDAAEALEALGRSLYRQRAVREHIDRGRPLDVEAIIAEGIRRRRSARQIAEDIRRVRP
jgi:HK97 family phage portal protein